MTSKPPEAPPSLPPSTLGDVTAAKIPSIPVLAVGTPSRPPPGSSAALAAGIIPPNPRAPQASQPLISTPSAPPTSSEPPSRTDSNPPTGRRLAPPPKTRRQSVPAPSADGNPVAAGEVPSLVEIVRSAPSPAPPADGPSTSAAPAPAAWSEVLPPALEAAPEAVVPPAPAVPSAVILPAAAVSAAVVTPGPAMPTGMAPPPAAPDPAPVAPAGPTAPAMVAPAASAPAASAPAASAPAASAPAATTSAPPPAYPAFPPVPAASPVAPPAPAGPATPPVVPAIAAVPPVATAPAPGPASVPPKPVPQPPRPQATEPMLGRAAQEATSALGAEPPTRPAAEPPTRPTSAEPPPARPLPAEGAAPAVRPPSDRAPGALPPEFGLETGGHARVTPPLRLPLPLPRPSEPPPPAHVIVSGDASHAQSKPTPAPAINVMRIIAIGAPKKAPEVADERTLEEALADVEHDEDTPIIDRADDIPVDVVMEETELDDSELAPDSVEDKRPSGEFLELEHDEALSVPPEAPLLPDTVPDLAASAAEARGDTAPPSRPAESPAAEAPLSEGKQPPPPPLRKPQPPRRGDSSRPRPRRALKRPWWEDIFGEDFTRAVPRLSEKQVSREVDFIEESLGVAKGGVVLDLGCGAGHHAVDLAGRGYGVVGYDLSVYQLALAADVAQEHDQKINFLQGDMREMAFEAMFDGIYCWNTSFGYFEEDKNAAVAERVFRALKPGGMFLVDVANRDFAAMYSPSQLWYEGDSCVCMDDMSVDFITSRLRVKRSVIFDDGRSRECTYSIRLYSLHEIGKLLHDVGFRVTEASGHPSTPGVFFGELSPRLIVLAQKP